MQVRERAKKTRGELETAGSSEHSECSVMEDFLSKHFLQQVWPSDSAWIKTGKEGKKKDSSISATR